MMSLHRLAGAIAFYFALVPPILGASRRAADPEKVAQEVLTHAILIDTHADTPQMLLDEGYDLAQLNSPYMISIPKMREGRLGAEFMSIWVDTDWPRADLIHRALDLIDVVNEQVARHPSDLALARAADDVVRIHGQNKLALLLGVEGGHIIEDDLRTLDVFYDLGVRYMTLTHTKNTSWAGSSGENQPPQGLTDLGRQVVARMNRLGMMVDISHVSDQTFYDALAATRAPVIASHSSCRALCNVPRNMTDDMIRALAKNGGVMNINFYPGFIDQDFANAYSKVSAQMEAAVEAARDRLAKEGKWLSDPEAVKIERSFLVDIPRPSYTRIADHIDYAVKIAGVEHVGLGSDFDGIEVAPNGMEDCSKLPDLVRELARRGYSAEDLKKMLGGNLLRVMRQVEEVARDGDPSGARP